MYWRKKAADATGASKEDRTAWDAKTQAFFADHDRFDVYITSVTKRTGFGRNPRKIDRGYDKPDREYEISGLMTYPKYLLVQVKFYDDDTEFGTWFYNTYSDPNGEHRQPFLEIWVSDRDYAIREAIACAHAAALASGRKKSEVRFWKREGDGIFTEEEAKRGWSCESRYPLTGMLVWEQFESSQLPGWAVPCAHERFSTEGMPEWYDLKL